MCVCLLAGLAPATISFAAGQAAFTLTLLILFNILAPAGCKIGLVRVEDIALGCVSSLAVGLLFWPRGAGAVVTVMPPADHFPAVTALSSSSDSRMSCGKSCWLVSSTQRSRAILKTAIPASTAWGARLPRPMA